MGLDPYFTSAGEKSHTVFGEKRTIYTKEERAAADKILSTPERVLVFDRLRERVWQKKKITRVEMCFYHLMQRRRKILKFRPIAFSTRQTAAI